jgi:hypothetical protein
MHLGENPIPVAIGGVHVPWPGLPEGACFASAVIYLEAWASVRSGKVIELVDFSMSEFLGNNKMEDS